MIRYNKRGQCSIYIRQKYREHFEVFNEIARENNVPLGLLLGELGRKLKLDRDEKKAESNRDKPPKSLSRI
jgi:hypothetical protein